MATKTKGRPTGTTGIHTGKPLECECGNPRPARATMCDRCKGMPSAGEFIYDQTAAGGNSSPRLYMNAGGGRHVPAKGDRGRSG